jgi:hypothetical protein
MGKTIKKTGLRLDGEICDSQSIPLYLIYLDDNTRFSKEQEEELSQWWSKMKLIPPCDTPGVSPSSLDFSAFGADYCNWSDPLGISTWVNREARYYAVEALNLVTYFLDGAIDTLMWLMSSADELSNKLDKGS